MFTTKIKLKLGIIILTTTLSHVIVCRQKCNPYVKAAVNEFVGYYFQINLIFSTNTFGVQKRYFKCMGLQNKPRIKSGVDERKRNEISDFSLISKTLQFAPGAI